MNEKEEALGKAKERTIQMQSWCWVEDKHSDLTNDKKDPRERSLMQK